MDLADYLRVVANDERITVQRGYSGDKEDVRTGVYAKMASSHPAFAGLDVSSPSCRQQSAGVAAYGDFESSNSHTTETFAHRTL